MWEINKKKRAIYELDYTISINYILKLDIIWPKHWIESQSSYKRLRTHCLIAQKKKNHCLASTNPWIDNSITLWSVPATSMKFLDPLFFCLVAKHVLIHHC